MGSANQAVVVLFNRPGMQTQGLGPRMYSGQADAQGKFEIREDTDIFALSPGTYVVNAFTYDSIHQEKSAPSIGTPFTVSPPLLHIIFHRVDTFLNFLMIFFLLGGVATTLLSSPTKKPVV